MSGGDTLLSKEVCMAIEPLAAKGGVIVRCDRKYRHTGKHRCRLREGGLVQWWKTR